MSDIIFHTETRKVSDLLPYDLNPRKISADQMDQLKRSLEKFGLVELPAIDLDNRIIAGHQRIKALQLIGRGEEIIEVRIPNRKLTEAEFQEYNLRSNLNVGDWEYHLLSNFDEDLLKAIGFNATQIDRIFDLNTKDDEFDAEKEAANITVPTSQRGDVYQLGNHLLMCGDATLEADVSKLINDDLADLVFTDPPYMVDYKSPGGLTYDSTKFGGTGGKIFNDNLSDEEALQFYIDVLNNLYKFSKDYTPIYWWFANKNNLINRLAFDQTHWFMSQIIIWLKNSMIFSKGQDFHRCYEPCMFGWKKGKKHFKNREIANYKDVFGTMDFDEFQHYLDVWFQKRDTTTEYMHPTQKPIKLAERALHKSSKPDDIVVDLFGGSGSTLMACEQMHRKARIMELDPKYVDVIILRWERFTGNKAVKI